jgi:hypothetical protein
LPHLASAANREAMREVLACHLGTELRLDSPGQLTCRVLKHTPGKRCVIAYDLDRHGKVTRLIGKLYRKDRGEASFANLQRLWQAAQRTGFRMPEPLAYLPELGMVLQTAVPGVPLTPKVVGEPWSERLAGVARHLALLHSLEVRFSTTKGFYDHVAKYYRPESEAALDTYPDLRSLLVRLWQALLSADRLHAVPVGPVHGDVHFAHLYVDGRDVYLIDFDGACLSHAALDVGSLLVALRVYCGPQSQALERHFLRAYLTCQPPESLVGLDQYEALAYWRRALICLRQQRTPAWSEQVGQHLHAGMACLAGKRSVCRSV